MAFIGYVSIHRKIWANPIWDTSEPFDKRSAWVDLILLANHERKEIVFDGNVLTVEKGQFITSEVKLANRWHWKRDKVHKYLMLLVKLGMITKKSTSRSTTVTIVNYEKFQVKSTSNRATTRATTGASLGATTGAQTIMNNNNNNELNNIYMPSAQNEIESDDDCYTEEEWAQMCSEYKEVRNK